ncbi:hypothetical protein E2C01_006903 [Portunus trituberculatus]|uniref:Uncharacterized protein n=1 Tax=Portunus trituberculatus TaxID=210409 RepID=A0A5B7D0Y4_PORTR|nr:hypothetical protein [Portunus trituberculatus]
MAHKPLPPPLHYKTTAGVMPSDITASKCLSPPIIIRQHTDWRRVKWSNESTFQYGTVKRGKLTVHSAIRSKKFEEWPGNSWDLNLLRSSG